VSVSVPGLGLPVVVVFATTDVGVTFSCRVDGKPWAACTSPLSISGLSSGKHRIEVRTINGSGKMSDVAGKDFKV
jgi:hypothetical protein